MRPKAGDPPRTMAQKILAGRAADPSLAGELVEVKVDQVVLARDPARAVGESAALGAKRSGVELAVAYDTACVRGLTDTPRGMPVHELLAHGLLVARAGVGFPEPVHLERFASPARLAVTDEARLAGVGGIGMLALVAAPAMLGQALARGRVWVRPPCSIQVQLGGKMRPFVCARDVALELFRRGVGDVVREAQAANGAPVVLEFVGAGARLLSVGERAVLCAMAPELGAAGALFVGDERTEVFLRDQRRSKAHRVLAPDAGAPFADVVALDLAAIDPLLRDEDGKVVPVRDLAGKPVSQVLLGGDGGVTLRDLFSVAALLKAKRVPSGLDFLLAVPSRQMLEVLTSAGALLDLIATGARLVEPDARITSGGLYPPPSGGTVGLRTTDSEPRAQGGRAGVVASAETLAYAVATGQVGDPRAFKRPVRVTVPRVLPTDDVLVSRERRAESAAAKKAPSPSAPPFPAWKGRETLELVEGVEAGLAGPSNGKPLAVVCANLDEVRLVAARAAELVPNVRAVMAPFIPSALVTLFSGLGIVAAEADAQAARGLKGKKTVELPPPAQWALGEATAIATSSGKVSVRWLALERERAWLTGGGAQAPARRAPG